MAYNTGTVPTLAELITANFIPTKFSKDALMHTKSNLVVAASVNTTYRDDLRQGYIVYIPVFSEVTDAEVTPGTVPTAVNTAGTPTSITVDKWRVAAVEISDMAQIEDIVGYLSKAAESCAYRIVKRVDTALGALFSTLSSSSCYGSDGQTMTGDIILAIKEGLDEADIPREDRCMIGDPSMEVDMLKIDKFVRSDYVREGAIPSGQIGRIYGMPVKITNNLTGTGTSGNYGVMMHRDALGLAIQENPRSQTVAMPGQFRTLVMVDVIYGVAKIRDTFGKSFYTRSA